MCGLGACNSSNVGEPQNPDHWAPRPKNPNWAHLCIPGIVLRPDSRDSYSNIRGNIPESHFDKNICIIQNSPTHFWPCSIKRIYFQGRSPVHFSNCRSRHLAFKEASGAFASSPARKVSMDEPIFSPNAMRNCLIINLTVSKVALEA